MRAIPTANHAGLNQEAVLMVQQQGQIVGDKITQKLSVLFQVEP